MSSSTSGLVIWNDKYSVGIPAIDKQHKRLVDIINELHRALTINPKREKIQHVLDELIEYTRIHFAVEETLMEIFDYEEYETHKAIHDKIVNQVTKYYKRFEEGDDSVGADLTDFLSNWLIDHIVKVDTKYSKEFLKAVDNRGFLSRLF